MRFPGWFLVALCALLCGAVCFGEPPKDLGLVERAERTLVQLTVRIHPATPQDRQRAAHLTKDDFSIVIDQTEIPASRFELDNYCPEFEEPVPAEPAGRSNPGKYALFFVDELGPEGQDNARTMLARMIPQMAAGGYRMKVLPRPETGWTDDVERLQREVAALFDPDAASEAEEDQAGVLRTLLASGRVDDAIAVARDAEAASQLSFEGPTLQLARALYEMGSLPSPKALIYFAEMGQSFREMIVDTAIRAGVPVYAVKADGMPVYDPSRSTANDPGAIITTSLYALSDHTGGRFGFGGFRPKDADRIVERVRSDLSCLYVVSLDAAGLPRDRLLQPKIRLKAPLRRALSARTIPDVTIPNERRRREQEAAMVLRSGRWPGVLTAGVSLVPLGADGSRATARIQFEVETGPSAEAIPAGWDVGVNYFASSRVSGYGGLRVTSPGPKVVFEKSVTIPFGPYSIVGVAQEAGGPGLARGTAAGVLARPRKNEVGFVRPPELLHWEAASFVAEGEAARKAGWTPLRFGMARADRALSLATSLCRGSKVRGTLSVETVLRLPERDLPFASRAWREGDASCRVGRDDLFDAGQLPWAGTPYEATVLVTVKDATGRSLGAEARTFWVIGPRDARQNR